MKITTVIATFAALTSTAFAGNCESGPFQDGRYGVGAGSGIARCETRWDDGLVINGIEVWYEGKGKSWIRGIQFQYSNGDLSEVLGNADGNSHRIEWDAAKERVEKVTLWGDGKGTSVGRIKIRTTAQDMDVGKGTDGQTAYDQLVGSGVLLVYMGLRVGRLICFSSCSWGARSRAWRFLMSSLIKIRRNLWRIIRKYCCNHFLVPWNSARNMLIVELQWSLQAYSR